MPVEEGKPSGNEELDITVPDSVPVDEHEEEVSEGGIPVRRRGVFLLPNLITSGALFGGFLP